MKTLILKLALLLMLLFPISGFSLEFLWVDDYGRRLYDCGGHVVGGRAAVKDKGYGIYRVKSVLINREIRANSILHAGRIACGEAKEEPMNQQNPETEEKAK